MASAAPPSKPMTTEEMLALPADGRERELIRGELRERSMTMRNRTHSRIEIRVGKFLDNWLDAQPEPRGLVVGGEAGFRLMRDPDTAVGIDVAFVAPQVVARSPDAAFFDGPPVLAVEILSPSDVQEDIDEKVGLYLESGVSLVWVLHPRFRTVTVYRPDAEPELFHIRHELAAEPHLPGFRVPVARLFDA